MTISLKTFVLFCFLTSLTLFVSHYLVSFFYQNWLIFPYISLCQFVFYDPHIGNENPNQARIYQKKWMLHRVNLELNILKCDVFNFAIYGLEWISTCDDLLTCSKGPHWRMPCTGPCGMQQNSVRGPQFVFGHGCEMQMSICVCMKGREVLSWYHLTWKNQGKLGYIEAKLQVGFNLYSSLISLHLDFLVSPYYSESVILH